MRQPGAIGRAARLVAFALLAIATVSLQSSKAEAVNIQRVVSPLGIEAWLVEEHGLPLVAMQFAFRGGATQDPDGRPGVAHFLTTMLDEGAGDLDAKVFQERTEDLAMRLSFDTGRDQFTGSFQSLAEHLDEGADLLRLALTQPRFDADALERMRTRLLSDLAFDAKDPQSIAARLWFETAFGTHPYGRPVKGTPESVAAITRDDLEGFRRNTFARDGLKISIVGDITAEAAGRLIDSVFGALPAAGELRAIAEVLPAKGPSRTLHEMDNPQAVAQFGHAGIARKDPDYVAAFVLNYIIGGGGFSSRLTEQVREKRGLAYSVYSYIDPYERSHVFFGGVATKNEAIEESLTVIRQVLEEMLADGPGEEELANAKQYLIGSYALRFDTSSKIASQLLWIQIEELGIDYIDNRNGLIESVSMEDLRRVAKRLLRPDSLIVTIVGRPQGNGKAG
ncbi:MAG: insulinase family protein [Rhizobiales bacterium]|nr:insulinase family protein [Hyphomicrobiales bacterium]